MNRFLSAFVVVLLASAAAQLAQAPSGLQPHARESHLRNIRQLTFGGENAEAYFSMDGTRLIYQSTRQPYACDQIVHNPTQKVFTFSAAVTTGGHPMAERSSSTQREKATSNSTK